MITYNTLYHSKNIFNSFLEENNISNDEKYLIQIFCGIPNKSYIQNLITDILSLLPNSSIIGSTTDGEITNAKVTTQHTTISITKFENSSFCVDYIEYDNKTMEESSFELASKIVVDDTKVIISFADGLHTDGEQFLLGFEKFNNDIIVAGGLSGDNSTFKGTYVFTNNHISSNGAVGVSINGDINVSTDYNFNWEPIGKELTITKVENNVVYTIDDKTAYDTYKYYLGEDVAKRLPAIGIEFPLIIKRGNIKIARAVLGKNDDGSLVFAGDLKKGDVVQFGYGNSELILNNANKAAMNLNNIPVESIFIYSCMARRRFMPNLIESEIEPLTLFGTVSGFFTYGEFYTNIKYKKELLNQTMTVLALSESYKNKNITLPNKLRIEDDNVVTNKALSYLINVTSNELHQINKNLQESLKREQKIISEQNDMIFAQGKMAQMGDMIGNIAHQWRQPLSNISTAITAIQVQNELGVLTNEFFDDTSNKVMKNVKYLSETISTFRDFLREEKDYKEYVLQDILKQVFEIVSPSLKDYHISLIDEINYKEKITLMMIAGELSQVLINIINNAKDAIIENKIQSGYIKLTCFEEGNWIYITIEDNAGGIPDEILDKIFEPYFTTKDKDKGTGLGLHMTKEIISRHMAGNIYVKNTKIGAKFFLEIPTKRN